jgi:hypothetical protein
MISELTQEVIRRIEATEGRERSRRQQDQLRFEYSVSVVLLDLWQSVKCTPMRECLMNKRSGYYSENPRYRDPNLTYKQMMAVFNGLLKLGFIEVTKEGHFDRDTSQGSKR